jgi:hypothetical protein
MPNKRWTVDELARACISHCPHELQVDAGEEHDCIWYECARAIRRGGTEAPSTSEVDLGAKRKRHVKTGNPETDFAPHCGRCQVVWPCDAIQLADEVERLRIKLDTHADINAENGNENIRLQETLDFYADEKTWEWKSEQSDPEDPDTYVKRLPALLDRGKIARAALAGEEVSGG